MRDVVSQIAVWLNGAADQLGRLVLAPLGFLPGWLSATAVAAVTGVFFLAVFKYTSNQRAIGRVRNDIDAHLLALKLFKDSPLVVLKAQGRVMLGALRLLVLALVPMLVMVVPAALILGQLSLWYQVRPLKVGEDSVITLKLGGEERSSWPAVSLEPSQALDVSVGPVRLKSKREVCWSVKAREPGSHMLAFRVDDRTFTKELKVGDGFMRVSAERPAWGDVSSIMMNPGEDPFRPDDPVRSIAIVYPQRSSWTSGTDTWVIYWFIVSMVAALCCRGMLGVKV
jgi:hypothetical protein